MNKITRTTTCWKIELNNGKMLHFTDSDYDVIYKGNLYISGSYFTPSCIISSNELGQDNFSISGIIDGKYIDKKSLISGDFSDSYIEIFLINLDNLLAERIFLKAGLFGEVKYSKQRFTVEIRSLGWKTNNIIGKCYSRSCRSEFGDKECNINIKDYSFTGTVNSLAETNCFIDKKRNEPEDYFSQGTITFISGNNYGRKYKIREFRNKKITLDSIIDLKISIGDQYNIVAGCDKALSSCTNKFNNALCFRGEPFIPNKNKLVTGI